MNVAPFVAKVADELKLPISSVAAVARMLGEGATVPFIARYRKEATGSLDEVAITAIRDRATQLVELESRRSAIFKSLEERNLLNTQLRLKIQAAESLTVLEDLFAPYRPKRRTRATIARERGLEPLADWLISNQFPGAEPQSEAAKYVVQNENADKTVATLEDALAGARDILAERFSDDAEARQSVRALFEKEAIVSSKLLTGKETDSEAAKYRDYFAWSEPLSRIPSHRLLAIRRGEAEGFLTMRVTVDETQAIDILRQRFVKGSSLVAQQVFQACEDSFKRLLGSSLETEARLASKQRADKEAIRVFAENVRELLMAAPLGQKRTLAIDPGFRTGCKLAILDAQGKLLLDDVIYPTAASEPQVREARQKVQKLVEHFQIEAIAIGNGTAGRETEAFIRSCALSTSMTVVMVNESGASIYSASEIAREEFPEKDLTVRGAVSIGRRLMDPLAELVKLDPKSIGVGQYQHDVDQALLHQALDDTVISCVNRVGVEVNTASRQLLSYVSGLNKTIAENIVKTRNEHGPFKSRAELRNVPRFGAKTFEQAAGFLRIQRSESEEADPSGGNPLDASAVHPERYEIVEQMARDLGCSVRDLLRDPSLRAKIDLNKYVSESVGLPTLQDIQAELAKPGRDPREKFEQFSFSEGVQKPADLRPGMKIPGIVTNVAAFGAFVDIGVHQDGLVHVSQMADQFVKNPAEVLKVGQRVTVTVIEVDLDRNRISLSLKSRPEIVQGPGSGKAPRQRPAPNRAAASAHVGDFGLGALADAFDKALKK